MDYFPDETLTQENERLKLKLKELEDKAKEESEDIPYDGGSRRFDSKRDW
jgi:hypothetical protein